MSLSDSQGGGWCELNGASVIGKLGSLALMDAGPGLWTFENGLRMQTWVVRFLPVVQAEAA